MSNISKLNGYDIKDKVARQLLSEFTTQQTEINNQYINLIKHKAYYFDTLDTMLDYENFEDGDFAITYGYYTANDNGGNYFYIREKELNEVADNFTTFEINEDLIAELIILNECVYPEQFGAKGDYNTNDYDSIVACLDYANDHHLKVEMNKEYVINSTLNFNYDYLIVDINTIKYTGNDYTIKLTGSYNIINIRGIISETGGGLLINPTNTHILNNDINLMNITSKLHCINLETQIYGIAYNKIKFSNLVSSVDNNCINCYSHANSSTAAYIGENTINGGRCSRGVWGIYAKSEINNSEITGLKIYNVALEGVTNGIYFERVYTSIIQYPRIDELQNQDNNLVFKLVGRCINNYFKFNTILFIDKIDVSEITSAPTSPTILNSPVRVKNGSVLGDGLKMFIGTELNITGGIAVIQRNTKYLYTERSTNFTETKAGNLYNYFRRSANTDIDITLNEDFNQYGIDTIIIEHPYETGITTNVKDINGTTLFTVTTKGKHTFKCVSNAGTPVWKEVSILEL